MKIIGIDYNWYSTPENGEACTKVRLGYTFGDVTCDLIEEHRPAGEGDKWYYDIHYSNGTKARIFNPNEVYFSV